MPAYRVEFTKSAKKEFEDLSSPVQSKILDALALLTQNPFSELLRIKKLKGAPSLYRIRIGDYRLVYEIRGSMLVVVVIKIGHRKDVYRQFSG